ncbi:homeobox-like domain superfamily [Holotrichia oblita]|uniref:Homeobox-like domain superfamily n=1 Tax=Holotrichia oblita TaxID=644536 RepID=A0ACB9SKV1_HOLOL|nr:homeobox-like domain superfamily [Holotrichia oblita]
MVRNYERKKPKRSYTKADLEQAVQAVQAKKMGSLRARKIYKIPQTIIMDHLKDRRGVKSQTMGRPPALSENAEEKLAE